MYKTTPKLFTCVLLALLLINAKALLAQPNPVTNFGFEASSSSLTGWTTSNHPGTSAVAATKMHSGAYSFTNNYSKFRSFCRCYEIISR
jgi:hypothetical protein